MTKIRKEWVEKVGEASDLVVELYIEAFVPRYRDPPCRVRGCVGIPSPPYSDEERFHLARSLVEETVLPVLRPNFVIRILDMTTKRSGTRKTIEVKNISMPRFMHWEAEYVKNPYTRALPMKDLNKRFLDVMVNMEEISTGGKLGVRNDANSVAWWSYFQHVLTEAKMRELPFPLFLDNRCAPDWDKDSFTSSVKGHHSSKAFEAIKKWKNEKDKEFSLVKYGECCYMEEFIKEGKIQIQPSRNFDDEALNQAIRDDENKMSVFGIRIEGGRVIPANDIRGWGDRYSMLEYSSSMDRDYMMYCMAATLAPTLFSHFGPYDACVLIHDMDEFVRRINVGTSNQFLPQDFIRTHGKVTYLDPLGAIGPTPDVPEGEKLTIPFMKHYRHTYQDEFRFVWIPRTPKKDLAKVILSIGSLEDIAEIIRI